MLCFIDGRIKSVFMLETCSLAHWNSGNGRLNQLLKKQFWK